MNNLVLINPENKVTTTSLLVAEKFGKDHKFVMRKIRELKCSNEFLSANFAPSSYIGKDNAVTPMYEITEEGFMFIAMRFTGNEAVKWQEAFITAFQSMRKQLTALSSADQEMLRISRIDTRTMKAISKTRNNALVHENYATLVKLGILEEKVETRKVTRYRFTADGADYSNGYFHGIPRFEPELHEKIIEVINGFKKGLEFQGDLFIERD
jgi:Rha family phage regulatory protein